MKPTLIGESNPYGSDPYYALYPAPDGCAGHRLCCLILGMQRKTYLDTFERINLCEGRWSIREARKKAEELWDSDRRLILLGSKVASAFGTSFQPFSMNSRGNFLILPHPSGLCRLWQQVGAIETARKAVGEFLPELVPLMGKGV